MLSEPAAWKRLLGKLVTVQADYLLAQAKAGAQALQVFDSWAGRALGREDYLRYVAPAQPRALLEAGRGRRPGDQLLARRRHVPASTRRGAGATSSGSTGTSRSTRRGSASASTGRCRGTSTRPRSSRRGASSAFRIDDVLERAGGRPGHVFNVGHGLVPADAAGQRAPARRARAGANVEVSARLPIGVLVMAYGGPASLDEIPGYLADIRHGRPTPREVLEEITENYRAIGGGSPLLEVTRRQVDALAERLGERLPLLPRHAPLGAVDRGGRRGDGRGRHRRTPSGSCSRRTSAPCRSRATSRRSPTGSSSIAGGSTFGTSRAITTRPAWSRRSRARVEEGIATLAGGGARPRPRRLQRSQPPDADHLVRRPVRRSVPGDGAARRRAGRALGRSLVVVLAVRRALAGAVGRAGHRRSPRGSGFARAFATSSPFRSASSPTTSRSSSTSTTARRASRTGSACGSSVRRR